MALLRTLGCAICDFMLENCADVSVQRPGSTQKTPRSTGSLSAGMTRSFAITRSCLPPVTISPASRMSGRLELFTRTRLFTWAPELAGTTPRGPATHPADATRLSNNDLTRADALIQGDEAAGVVRAGGNDWEDGEIAVGDGTEDFVI